MKPWAVFAIAVLLTFAHASGQSRVAADMYRVAAQAVPNAAGPDEAHLLVDVLDAELNQSARNIVGRGAHALETLQAATKVTFGDWGFDPDDPLYAGKTLPRAVELADLAFLHARLRAADERFADALDDCFSVATLARRLGVQPSVLRQMLQLKLFERSMQTVGTMLLDAPPADVKRFLGRLEELRSPVDPVDVAIVQRDAFIAFYRRAVEDPTLRRMPSSTLDGMALSFGLHSDPVDVEDLLSDPDLAERVLDDAAAAFNQMIEILKSSQPERSAAMQVFVRRIRSSHPLVRNGINSVGRLYDAGEVQSTLIELVRAAALISEEVPRPLTDDAVRKRAGQFGYSRVPGGFELLGTIAGRDEPVVLRVGPRPVREKPATQPQNVP